MPNNASTPRDKSQLCLEQRPYRMGNIANSHKLRRLYLRLTYSPCLERLIARVRTATHDLI